MTKAIQKLALTSAVALACTAPVQAANLIDDLKNSSIANVESGMTGFSKNLTAVFAHRGLAPADTLGGGVGGFELGLDVSAVDFDSTQLKAATGGSLSSTYDINTIPLPKVSAAFGLPVIPIDVAVTYFPKTDLFSYMSAQVKYSLINGGVAMPAVAIAGSYSKAAMGGALETTTMGLDASISKGFGIGIKVVPYAGAGYVSGSTTITPEAAIAGVKTSYTDSAVKTFAGVGIQLGIINLVGQWDKIGTYQSYSAKVGLRF